MRTGPKYKICKRLGSSVFEKCQTQKFMLSEERRVKSKGRGGRRPRSLSDYGRQLLEKQKVRYTYGLSEKQLSRYVKEATEHKGHDPIQTLLASLESRLDNAIYRIGLANTRALARQIVSHGHILVNKRKVTIPSYVVKEGDVIAIREGSREKILFQNLDERLKDYQSISWITFDLQKKEGEVKTAPHVDPKESVFDVGTVLEYYSR